MNNLILDESYLRLSSARLLKFKQLGPHRFNARCPICGDSKRSKSKARFHVFEHEKKASLVCHCFNCSYSSSFDNFLKEIDPDLHKQYLLEKFKLGTNTKTDAVEFKHEKPIFEIKPIKDLKKISQLSQDHPAKKYVESRQIPSNTHYKLYYAPQFKKWANSKLPGKFDEESLERDEPRLILPFLTEDKKMYGFQGRSFDPNSKNKYITIVLDKSHPRLFGLETVDFTRKIMCVEGPIDSLFLDNCIASCGGDIEVELELINCTKDGIVVVYDNEPRSKETVRKMSKVIEKGYDICIWPQELEYKDVNDMIQAGYTPQQIEDMIHRSTYNGLEAGLVLTHWKKC